MKIRLYLDEDSMSRSLVRALQARGVDVTTALDEEMIGHPDESHLNYATQQGRILYSCNVGDFFNLHTRYLTQGKSHAGIILAPQQRYSIGEQVRRLLKLIAAKTAEEIENNVEFISSWD